MIELKQINKQEKERIVSICIARDVSNVYCKESVTGTELRIKYHNGNDGYGGTYDMSYADMEFLLDSIYERMTGHKSKDFKDITDD